MMHPVHYILQCKWWKKFMVYEYFVQDMHLIFNEKILEEFWTSVHIEKYSFKYRYLVYIIFLHFSPHVPFQPIWCIKSHMIINKMNSVKCNITIWTYPPHVCNGRGGSYTWILIKVLKITLFNCNILWKSTLSSKYCTCMVKMLH